MTNLNVEYLTKKFNRVNGTRFQASASSINAMFESVAHFGEDLIEEIIEANPSDSISSIINPKFAESYLETKKLRTRPRNTTTNVI